MRSDFWSGMVVFLAACLLMFWIIPAYGGRGLSGSISPKFMPTVGVAIMMAASAAVWVNALVGLLRSGHRVSAPVDLRSIAMQLWPFAFVALAVAVVTRIGLIYSGPFMIAALLLLLRERRPLVILPAALIPPALIWVLATQLMRVGMV